MINSKSFDITITETSTETNEVLNVPETETSISLPGVKRITNSVTFTYTSGGVQYTLTNQTAWNILTGDGSGSIDDNDIMTFTLAHTPDSGSGFTINYIKEVTDVAIVAQSKPVLTVYTKFFYVADNPTLLSFNATAIHRVHGIADFQLKDNSSTVITLGLATKLYTRISVDSPNEAVIIQIDYSKYPSHIDPIITLEVR